MWRRVDEELVSECLATASKAGAVLGDDWGTFNGERILLMVITPPQHRTDTDLVRLIYDAALDPWVGDQDGKKYLIPKTYGVPVHRSTSKIGVRICRLQS